MFVMARLKSLPKVIARLGLGFAFACKIGSWYGFSGLLILDLILELKDRALRR